MTESKVVNSWIEAAVNKQRLDDAREFLIRLLERRFPGQISPEVIGTINAQPSLSLLKDWFDQASEVASLADFVRVLRA